MVFVMQSLSSRQTVNRVVTHLCNHPNADISVGLVGLARDPMTADEVPYELAPNCRLSFKQLSKETELMGFGYPRVEKIVNKNLHTFNLHGSWSKGIVDDFHSNGFSRLKNRCYRTNMVIESGASGGPVFNNGYVIGTNSSSFEMCPEDNPISFVTPVDYLLDLQLPVNDELMTVRNMVDAGVVVADF